ncbi:MAG: DNA-processing protein DprA [Clostridia bacterium]|nr:DNA-processing protein DprA [Clostridia bacterium]
MKDESVLYWVWLAEKCGVASRHFRHLVDKYDDPFDIYRLEEDEIDHIEGIDTKLKNALGDKSLESSYSIIRYCKSNKVDIISYGDKRYPGRLRDIEDPPVCLYCLGKFPQMDSSLCIGIVGTRKMSEYGKQSAYKISYELAGADCIIVSGMALGIDGVAACGAISAEGRTVAVLGSGISVIYPKEHKKLMKEITKKGAVITEFPPFERPNPWNFPKRNRIISGLCQGILVVEGAAGSGALITASKAIAQGRALFALPGKVNESNSDGPNELIRQGATIALSSADILAEFEFLYGDVINTHGHLRATEHSDLDERELKKMSVYSSTIDGHRFIEADQSKNTYEVPKKEQKSESIEAKKSGKDRKEQESVDKNSTENDKENNKLTEEKINSILEGLDSTSRIVYNVLPRDRSFTAELPVSHGMNISDVVTALTFLEINGLISSLPGGAYKVN